MSGAVNVTRMKEPPDTGSAELITDAVSRLDRYEELRLQRLDPPRGPVISGSDRSPSSRARAALAGDRDPRPISQLGYAPDQEALFEDGRLPHNQLSGHTWQGKVTWALGNDFKLRAGTLGSIDKWLEYRHVYLFDIEHSPRYEDSNNSVFGTLTHSINPKTFYTVGMNWFYTERFRGDGVHFRDLAAYSRPDGNFTWDTSLPLFYYGIADSAVGAGASIWDDYLHRESSYIGAKGDLSLQWTPQNQGKFGIEYRRHTLRRYRHLYPQRIQADLDRSDHGRT
jgi:hypothetical protein